MKKLIAALALLIISCNSEAPLSIKYSLNKLDNKVEFLDATTCKHKQHETNIKSGDIYEYNLLENDEINKRITRRLNVNNIQDRKVDFVEYYISESMPPMLGDRGQQILGFLPTRSGNRSLIYDNIESIFSTLEVDKTVDIPMTEHTDQGGSQSGVARLTFKGCGTLTEVMGDLTL